MENIMSKRLFTFGFRKKHQEKLIASNLAEGKMNVSYIIESIDTDNAEIKDFLFTLGCYEGEKVTIISKLAENYVISVKDSRYSIDKDLAKVIKI